MATFNFIKKPCAHEMHGVSTDQTVPDFHPLTYSELKGLVSMAFNGSCRLKAQIQCRLTQAVPGHVCPHPIDGPVAEKMSQLDSTYVEGIRGNTDGLVDKLARILNITP
ncbi:MAG: hypothetical protein ACAH80_10180 [Alphaproteobacteria bacterium]